MYHYIIGKVTEVTPKFITLECNQMGYLLNVPNPYRFHISDDYIKVYTELVIREDSHTLYGFLSNEEKDMFQSLLKVTGIGPKSALAILSTSSPNEVISAIENENQKYLEKFPGIGKKTASQIILDLKGKFDFTPVHESSKHNGDHSEFIKEALLALEALGYSKREIGRIETYLKKQNIDSVDTAIKLGLKYLVQ